MTPPSLLAAVVGCWLLSTVALSWSRPDAGLAYTNSLRTGDTTPSITGVLTFSFSEWVVEPTVEPEWNLAANARQPPPDVGGRARVSSFNV
jgi:uncharacterized protein